MPRSWKARYAQRTERLTSSAIRELLTCTEHPDFITFAGGLPAPEIFPVVEIAEAAQRIRHDHGRIALQYGATEGYRPLRAWVAEHMRAVGVPAAVENVLITTGSQQALDLLGKVFIDRGDHVMVESPTYLAALQAWSLYGAEYLAVAADADGMRVDALHALLPRKPKFIYCLPNFQNPSGVTLSLERRHRLVDLATRHDIAIIEDDPYRDLRFEGEHLPRLISLASAHSAWELASRAADRHASSYQGAVNYLSTFSKVIAPGLRVGSVVATEEVIRMLTQAKQAADLHTASLNQLLVYELVRDGLLERHLPVILDAYRLRRDVMLDAITRHFPPQVQWTHPAGGFFLWVTLPEGLDAADVLREAVAHRVTFVPGAPFHATGNGAHTLRLNFSNATPELIREGVERLGGILRTRLDAAV